ncbi:hypothetical protein BDW71DRAFT_203177 [Aspergillus fruticulosus]
MTNSLGGSLDTRNLYKTPRCLLFKALPTSSFTATTQCPIRTQHLVPIANVRLDNCPLLLASAEVLAEPSPKPTSHALITQSSAHTWLAPPPFSLSKAKRRRPPKLATSAASAGSTHLDIVIPRAGVAKPGRTPAIVAIDDVVNVFSVNAVGALRLLQATGASLECPKKEPKLVQREMGNKGAQMMETPNTTEEAITKTMATIDGTTQENSSGKYLNIIDGTNFGDDLYRKDYDEKEKRRRCLAG